ncbi:hypothetical protein GF342_00935 [Candidatus Woesearchaeota archaeon]|nr:hypothetical protein [Candidatus Woesearchaeota archaeon]
MSDDLLRSLQRAKDATEKSQPLIEAVEKERPKRIEDAQQKAEDEHLEAVESFEADAHRQRDALEKKLKRKEQILDREFARKSQEAVRQAHRRCDEIKQRAVEESLSARAVAAQGILRLLDGQEPLLRKRIGFERWVRYKQESIQLLGLADKFGRTSHNWYNFRDEARSRNFQSQYKELLTHPEVWRSRPISLARYRRRDWVHLTRVKRRLSYEGMHDLAELSDDVLDGHAEFRQTPCVIPIVYSRFGSHCSVLLPLPLDYEHRRGPQISQSLLDATFQGLRKYARKSHIKTKKGRVPLSILDIPVLNVTYIANRNSDCEWWQEDWKEQLRRMHSRIRDQAARQEDLSFANIQIAPLWFEAADEKVVSLFAEHVQDENGQFPSYTPRTKEEAEVVSPYSAAFMDSLGEEYLTQEQALEQLRAGVTGPAIDDVARLLSLTNATWKEDEVRKKRWRVYERSAIDQRRREHIFLTDQGFWYVSLRDPLVLESSAFQSLLPTTQMRLDRARNLQAVTTEDGTMITVQDSPVLTKQSVRAYLNLRQA